MAGDRFGDDTIFARSTGAGRAGVAIVRASGPAVREMVMGLCGSLPSPRMARYGRLRDPQDGTLIDEAVVLFFPAPGSFTGEDVAEFQVHGAPAVVARLTATLGRFPGARMARPGEFTRRAFLNGRLDLLEVEALGDLVNAETEWQRRFALEGGSKALRDSASRWREILIRELAVVEAVLEFADEDDVPDAVDSETKQALTSLGREIRAVLDRGRAAERLRDGFRVVLAGPPNAGKSSLLNALADRDVAIVSEIAGTTRDRIDVPLDMDGIPVIVSDTAGLRGTSDVVELQGVARAERAIDTADLVLWLEAPDAATMPPEGVANLIRVRTKMDLLPGSDRTTADDGASRRPAIESVAISARTGEGIGALCALIRDRAVEAVGDAVGPSAARLRQREALNAAIAGLERAQLGLPEELVAEELRGVLGCLDELIGRVDVEDVLDSVFSRFCIGK